jgi:hypothetical protein
MKKPYAQDWKIVHAGESLEYSAQLMLYWKDGMVYDYRSAAHNGLVGKGKQLTEIIRSIKDD